MLEFGVRVHLTSDFPALRSFALECEKLGFDSVWVNDHLIPPSGPRDLPFFDGWTILSALAPATRQIRLGTLVLCGSFRNPALLAKMSATLDVISGGRLELGLGAGWFEDEYVMYGIQFPRASVRVDQLAETAKVIRLMWTEERPTFRGKYYHIKDALNEPKPMRRPSPPIWIGGKRPRLLRVAAEFGDGWSYPYPKEFEEYSSAAAIFEKHCKAIGRSASSARRSILIDALVARNEASLREMARRRASDRGETLEQFERRIKTAVAGTSDKCIEVVDKYLAMGVDHLVLNFPSMKDLEPLQVFAEQVMPSFRKH